MILDVTIAYVRWCRPIGVGLYKPGGYLKSDMKTCRILEVRPVRAKTRGHNPANVLNAFLYQDFCFSFRRIVGAGVLLAPSQKHPLRIKTVFFF